MVDFQKTILLAHFVGNIILLTWWNVYKSHSMPALAKRPLINELFFEILCQKVSQAYNFCRCLAGSSLKGCFCR